MDPINERLLEAMEISGIVPNSPDQQQRLDELLAEGLCYRQKREAFSPGSPAMVYKLSIAGKAHVLSRRGGQAKGE